jgi:hypothetical protein
MLELFGELRELVVVRRENRLAADLVVQALRHRPGDGHAIVCRRAASYFIEQYQAARARAVQNSARFAHLDHKSRLAAYEIVGRAHAGEDAVDDAELCTPARDERADLRQYHAQPDLPQ